MAKSFSEAFREARSKFDSNPSERNFNFTWNGTSYNVLRKGETKSSLMSRGEGSTRPQPRPKRNAPEISPRPRSRDSRAKPGDVETRPLSDIPGGRGDGRAETVVRRAEAAIRRAEAGASNPPGNASTPRFNDRHKKPGNLARSIRDWLSENRRRGGLSNRGR